MRISSNFDSGNIEVIDASQPDAIRLRIRKDNQSEFYQWFHFRLETQSMLEHHICIEDLTKSAYPDAWSGYQAVASYDREEWFRVDSEFADGTLNIYHTPEHGCVYYAYFAPYSYDRHLDLIAWCQAQFDCQAIHLGETLDGRDMTMLQIGQPEEGKRNIWITARQHPGETMAEWLVEGLLERLLDEDDPLSSALRRKAVFYVVPNMNPDGACRGHLRTNAIGVNLNREWHAPSEEKSPEVFYVLNKMQSTGVDLFLDMHGDEAIPYNFLAGCEGNPGYSPRIADLEKAFSDALLTITPEFQDQHGYPKDESGKADLTIAANAIGERFDCLSYTLEMPFKDNEQLPDPAFGWSPERSKKLGEDVLVAVHNVINELR
ncbi:MAG: M14-type cytosolic carboxypeptidase [Aestuariibacter sp.]